MDDGQHTNRSYEIFLVGDTGSLSRSTPDAVLQTLNSHLNADQDSAVLFLGDNVYPRGLPANGHLLRKDAEQALLAHKNALSGYHGKVIFIPGNHDWNKGRPDGYEYILRQEEYLEKLFGRNVFLPSNGCPGPTKVTVNNKLVLIFINTQWWMQTGLKPIGKQYRCRVSSEKEFFEHLEQLLEDNKEKRILICGHAPVYSYAIHGGRYKLKHHLFPLTLYRKRAYVPLPFIGSLLPLYRKYFGAREDIAHPRYRRLRHNLKAIFAKHKGLIYAAGHEHNLQHICKDSNHYIVSGAGSKLKYVIESGKNLLFGMKAKGFFKLRVQEDGSANLSAWIVAHGKPEGKMVYETEIE